MGILFFILGLCFGSFGSVIISRMPLGSSLSGRSRCPACGKTLTPLELIPLVSYLVGCGRCSMCCARISLLYPCIEVLSGLLFLFAYVYTDALFPGALLALALWLLLVIAIIDAKTHTIADALNIPFVALGCVYGYSTGSLDYMAILVGAGFFGLLWTVSRGKWIGSGDILLGAGIGAFIGSWQMMIACLMTTYILGAFIVIFMLVTKNATRGSTVAFAPFLFLGTVVTLIFEQPISQLLWLQF